MNGKRILIFAAFLSVLFSCREPEPDIAPNTLSVTNYSDAAVESIRVTADGNVLLDSSSVNIHGDFLRLLQKRRQYHPYRNAAFRQR